MNANEKKYYLLGLNDAIKELQIEIDKCKEDMDWDDAYWHWTSALKCGILDIKDLIQATELGL